ncbi:MAG: amino acid ABC transporter ATP-binding protein [Cardiobacteriaceae bacterium]|nr:amino acid ABC transporter ATP-binding protein [Cardiobacteriaceae bacterium]
MLEIKGLVKSYGEHRVLNGIDLAVEAGEVVVILGSSGCGKSTLLRCINGLEEIQGGQIRFKNQVLGQDLNWLETRKKIGMVFQNYELFQHLSVWDNLLLAPISVQKRDKKEVSIQAEALLQRVGLLEKKHALPRQLSGGQKQRIAIIRALCLNPEIMLFDEITASLDPEMVREVLDVVMDLSREKMSMLIVTHEMGFARKVAHRIVFLDKGNILEETQDIQGFFTQPQTERARQFIHSFEY